MKSRSGSGARLKNLKEAGKPDGVRGPGRASDEVAVDDGVRHIDRDVGSAGELNFRSAGRIGIELAALDDAGSSEQLRAVTERGDRFVGLREVANEVENLWVKAKILRGPAAGNDEAVVVRRVDLVEGGIEREVVTAFFGVGLIAFEIVDRGADLIAFLLAGADCVDAVAYHLQGVERNHDLVVLNKIAGEQQ